MQEFFSFLFFSWHVRYSLYFCLISQFFMHELTLLRYD
jgi:hypothetical protein